MYTNWDDMVKAGLVLATGVLLITLLFARTQTIDNMRTDHCLLLGDERVLKGSDNSIASSATARHYFNDDCKLAGVPVPTAIPTPADWTFDTKTLEGTARWAGIAGAALQAGRYDADGLRLRFPVTEYLAVVSVPIGNDDTGQRRDALLAFDGLGNSREVQRVDALAFFHEERGGLLAQASRSVWSFFIPGFAIALLCLFLMELRGAPWDRRE